MRYVVTGASGFLGSWTVRALLADGHDVLALVRSPAPWRLVGVDAVDITVAEPADWPTEIAAARADVLVALDWSGVSAAEREGADQEANIARQNALVDAAVSSGFQRIVGIGSQAEYGWRSEPAREGDAPAPVTAYGHAKIAALRNLRQRCEASGIGWAWARVFSAFGPLDNDGVILAKVADGLRVGETVELSSARQEWSYLYASDAAAALATIAEPGRPDGVVNVAHPDAPPLRQSLDTFAAAVQGATGSLRFRAEPGPSLRADVARLSAMGWSPLVDTAAGLVQTAHWYSGIPTADPLLGKLLPQRPVLEG